MRPGRMMRATIEGVTYDIPEMWVAGFCQERPGEPRRGVHEAVAWWHAMSKLDDES